MIDEINMSGASRFGSGWSWLVMNKTSKRLQVHQQGICILIDEDVQKNKH